MKFVGRQIFILIISLVILATIFANVKPSQKPVVIGTSDLVTLIHEKQVKRIEIQNDALTVFKQDDSKVTVNKESGTSLPELLSSYGLTSDEIRSFESEVKVLSPALSLMRSMLPSLLFLIGFVVVFFILTRQMQGANNKAMSFGMSRAKQADHKKSKLSFKDVAGAAEAKQALEEGVDFLKNPKKYADIGAKIPKGVLMIGAPGTGKTLLARSVSGEANVPFFFISGSEFMEMFVGVGASRVRDLFQSAKKAAPCIIFIDEIDAVGRQRGAGVGGGHDEREQTLNQILVEMDGFDPTLGVIVMAATNRPDILDPALLRPGRFDRRVMLDLPSLDDREAILKVHSQNKPMEDDVNMRRIAERTIGFSGADLMNLMNEGAILAARHNKKKVAQKDFLEAIEKVMLGPERKSKKFAEDERTLTAYHEAGHAIVGHMLPYADEVHKVSIISRGMAAGYTMSLPDKDRNMQFRREFYDQMAMMLGGYAAEKIIYGDMTTGASSDLKKVTQTAKRLVTRYGMSEDLGPRTYGEAEGEVFMGRDNHIARDYSEKTAEAIDSAVRVLVEKALERAITIVKEQRGVMDKVVKVLLEKETIEKEEWEKLVGMPVKPPLVAPIV
jgi:cell division protease FtsH